MHFGRLGIPCVAFISFVKCCSYSLSLKTIKNVKQSKRPSISSLKPGKSQSRPSFRRPEERERPISKDSRESEENFPKRFRPPKIFRPKRPLKKITTTRTKTYLLIDLFIVV